MLLLKYICFLILVLSSSSFGQDNAKIEDQDKFSPEYRGVRIGMTWYEVLEILKKDPLLELDTNTKYGDFDHFYPILKVTRLPFIKEIYYQFTFSKEENYQENIVDVDLANWNLYGISISFDAKYVSYLDVFIYLKNKYGEPNKSESKATWWFFSDPINLKEKELESSKNTNNESNKYNEAMYYINLAMPSELKIMNQSILKQRRLDNLKRRKNIFFNYKKKMEKELLKDFISSKELDSTNNFNNFTEELPEEAPKNKEESNNK